MTREKMNEFAVRITQSTRTGLVAITCEIAVNYVETARQSKKNENKEDFRFNLKKAMEFVDNLITSLDMQYEIAANLLSLYQYVKKCIIHANATYTDENLDTVISIMTRIGEAFRQASQNLEENKEDNRPNVEGGQQIVAGITYGKNSLLNEYVVTKKSY